MEDKTSYKKSDIEELFGLAKIKGKVRVVVGNVIVSKQEFETFEKADEYINNKPYELIINTCALILKAENNEKKDNATKNSKNN